MAAQAIWVQPARVHPVEGDPNQSVRTGEYRSEKGRGNRKRHPWGA